MRLKSRATGSDGPRFSWAGLPPPHWYLPPLPTFDHDRERERGGAYFPMRSLPLSCSEFNPNREKVYTTDRERDPYEQQPRD